MNIEKSQKACYALSKDSRNCAYALSNTYSVIKLIFFFK